MEEKKTRVLDVDPSEKKKKAHIAEQSSVVELSLVGIPIDLSVPTKQTPFSVTDNLTRNSTEEASQTRNVVAIADYGVDNFLMTERERDISTETHTNRLLSF